MLELAARSSVADLEARIEAAAPYRGAGPEGQPLRGVCVGVCVYVRHYEGERVKKGRLGLGSLFC